MSLLYTLSTQALSPQEALRLFSHPAADSFSAPYRDDPRSPSEDVFDGPSVPMDSFSQPRFLKEKQALYASPTSKSRRRNVIILAALGGVILLIVVVVVPVYFLAIKPTPTSPPRLLSHLILPLPLLHQPALPPLQNLPRSLAVMVLRLPWMTARRSHIAIRLAATGITIRKTP
jgi:hypothetical protein